MAYNNIYEWHDSVLKELEKDRKDRRETMAGWMDRVGGDEQWVHSTIWDDPKNPADEAWERQSKIKRDPNDDFRWKWAHKHMGDWKDWLKDIEGAKERIKNMKTVCGKNPYWGSWKTDYDVKPDPNDITDLCKVEILK